jgi:hypothetical protein
VDAMRTTMGFLGLLLGVGMLSAADAPKTVTIRPNGTAAIKLGDTVQLAYPFKKDHTLKFKRLVIDKMNVLDLKEVHTGPADAGENNVIYKPKKIGTFKIQMEVFVGVLENAMLEKYNYTIAVKKKDDD